MNKYLYLAIIMGTLGWCFGFICGVLYMRGSL